MSPWNWSPKVLLRLETHHSIWLWRCRSSQTKVKTSAMWYLVWRTPEQNRFFYRQWKPAGSESHDPSHPLIKDSQCHFHPPKPSKKIINNPKTQSLANPSTGATNWQAAVVKPANIRVTWYSFLTITIPQPNNGEKQLIWWFTLLYQLGLPLTKDPLTGLEPESENKIWLPKY